MVLDDFKETWQQSGSEADKSAELSHMVNPIHNPRIKRIRLRMVIETILTLLFIVLVLTGLDSGEKPLWARITLVVTGLVYIINRLIGYAKLSSPKLDGNTRIITELMIQDIKKLSVTSTITALLMGSALLVFFSVNVSFDTQKTLLLGGMILTMLTFTRLSSSVWRLQIRSLKGVLNELSEKSDNLV